MIYICLADRFAPSLYFLTYSPYSRISVSIHPSSQLLQTRIQISSEYGALGMAGSTKKIIAGEGVAALWKGVNAAWLRESSYTSLRLGLYEPCKVAFGCTDPETTTFLKKFAAGSAAGGLGSLAGNPFDVLKTKMMASEAAGTPSIVGTAKEIMSGQGIKGFYRGIDSNIMRAMVLNGTKMGVYDQAKGVVVGLTGLERTSIVTSFLSAATAGFFMTCTVSPFDMIRTRLMNQPADAKIYNNAADCFVKICRNEGPLTLWRGFTPPRPVRAVQGRLRLHRPRDHHLSQEVRRRFGRRRPRLSRG